MNLIQSTFQFVLKALKIQQTKPEQAKNIFEQTHVQIYKQSRCCQANKTFWNRTMAKRINCIGVFTAIFKSPDPSNLRKLQNS